MTKRLFGKMYFKNSFAVFTVRQANVHPAVKATWAEQGRVEHVGAVGSGEHYNVLALLKTVHLDQNLVKSLLALVMAAAHAAAAAASHGVDFVDKNNARRVLFCLCKQITNTT